MKIKIYDNTSLVDKNEVQSYIQGNGRWKKILIVKANDKVAVISLNLLYQLVRSIVRFFHCHKLICKNIVWLNTSISKKEFLPIKTPNPILKTPNPISPSDNSTDVAKEKASVSAKIESSVAKVEAKPSIEIQEFLEADLLMQYLDQEDENKENILALLKKIPRQNLNIRLGKKVPFTPLQLAINKNSYAMLKYLLVDSSDRDLININLIKDGKSPLYTAVMEGGNKKFIRLLMQAGAKPKDKIEHQKLKDHAAANALEYIINFLDKGDIPPDPLQTIEIQEEKKSAQQNETENKHPHDNGQKNRKDIQDEYLVKLNGLKNEDPIIKRIYEAVEVNYNKRKEDHSLTAIEILCSEYDIHKKDINYFLNQLTQSGLIKSWNISTNLTIYLKVSAADTVPNDVVFRFDKEW